MRRILLKKLIMRMRKKPMRRVFLKKLIMRMMMKPMQRILLKKLIMRVKIILEQGKGLNVQIHLNGKKQVEISMYDWAGVHRLQ